LRPLAVFLLYTGARLGEALSLDWRDVSLSRSQCSIPRTKTGVPRAIALHPLAVGALRSLPHRTGRVFDYPHRWAVYVDWRRACHAAGLRDFTPHDCRHTFATWLRRYGGLDTLGLLATGAWRDPKSVARYAHVAPDEAQAAIARLPGKIRGPRGQRQRKPA
jgi:integrase